MLASYTADIRCAVRTSVRLDCGYLKEKKRKNEKFVRHRNSIFKGGDPLKTRYYCAYTKRVCKFTMFTIRT